MGRCVELVFVVVGWMVEVSKYFSKLKGGACVVV